MITMTNEYLQICILDKLQLIPSLLHIEISLVLFLEHSRLTVKNPTKHIKELFCSILPITSNSKQAKKNVTVFSVVSEELILPFYLGAAGLFA